VIRSSIGYLREGTLVRFTQMTAGAAGPASAAKAP
jgi:hypothetical protein